MRERYRQLLREGLQYDAAQERAVARLQRVQDGLQARPAAAPSVHGQLGALAGRVVQEVCSGAARGLSVGRVGREPGQDATTLEMRQR